MTDAQLVTMHEARFTIDLATHQDRAWHALTTELNSWWPGDFRATHTGSRMTLELHLGGRLLEDAGSGNGILWYQVLAIDAPNSLLMSGFIAPPFGGPATSLLRLSLHASGTDTSVLEVHDSLLGRVNASTVEEGWRAIFEQFAKYIGPGR